MGSKASNLSAMGHMSNEWEMSGIGRSLGELELSLSGLHRDYDKPLRHIPSTYLGSQIPAMDYLTKQGSEELISYLTV